jgi:hypothetical protein
MPVSEKDHIRVLSQLALDPAAAGEALAAIALYGEGDRDRIVKIADSHHVTIRAFGALLSTRPPIVLENRI